MTAKMMDLGMRKGDENKRRDKDGFIIMEDLDYDTSGQDVSQVIISNEVTTPHPEPG